MNTVVNCILTDDQKIKKLYSSSCKITINDCENLMNDNGNNTTDEGITNDNIGSEIIQQINLTQHDSYLLTHEPDMLYDRRISLTYQVITEKDDVAKHLSYYDPLNITNSAYNFNDNDMTFHNNNTDRSKDTWFGLYSDKIIRITHIGIKDSGDNNNLFAKSFAFETSTNGKNWIRQKTIVNHEYVNQLVSIKLDKPVHARYFRFYCVEGNHSRHWELSRLYLFSIDDKDVIYNDNIHDDLYIRFVSNTETKIINKSLLYYNINIKTLE